MYVSLFVTLFICIFNCAISQEIPQKYQQVLQNYEEELQRNPTDIDLIMALGDAYYYYKNYFKAVTLYSKAYALEPNDEKIKVSLGLAYLGVNDIPQSEVLFNEVYSKNQRNVNVLSGLGRIRALHHDYESADRFYHRALEIDPNNFTALYFLGELEFDRNNYEDAQKIFNKLLKADPFAKEVQQALDRIKTVPTIKKIQQLEDENRLQEAIRLAGQLQQSFPNNVEVISTLGQLYTKNKQFQSAIVLYKKALKHMPHSSFLTAQLAFVYLKQGHFSKALTYFIQNLTLNPYDSNALEGIGMIAELTGDLISAQHFYELALQNTPLDFSILNHLSLLYMDQKQYKKAFELYNRMSELKPNTIWIQQAIEKAKFGPVLDSIKNHENQHHYSEAIKQYLKLLGKHPEGLPIYLNLGQLYAQLHRFNDAIDIYQMGIKRTNLSSPFWIPMGNAYLGIGQIGLAYEMFEKAMEQPETRAEALIGFGRIALLSEPPVVSEYFFQNALNLDPYNMTALSYLSAIFMQQRKYDEAELLYKRILRMDPNAVWAKEGLERAHIEPELDIIRHLLAKDNTRKAVRIIEKLLKENPKNLYLYLELGRLYISLEEYDRAIALYRAGIAKNGDEISLKIALAFAYMADHRLTLARKTFLNAYSVVGDNADIFAGLGRISQLIGDEANAKRYYEIALRIDPENATALGYLIDLLYAQKRYEETHELYDELLKLQTHEHWITGLLESIRQRRLLDEIRQYEKEKKFDEAQALYHRLLAEAPNNVDYYIMFGNFYIRTKQLEKAISLYLKAQASLPPSKALQTALGYAYLTKNELNIAQNILESSLLQYPENSEAYAGLGLIAEKQKDFIKAQNLYEKALKIDPNDLTALSYMANLYLKQKNFPAAQKLFKRILKADPKTGWARQAFKNAKFGRLLSQIIESEGRNDFKETEILYKQLLGQAPDNSDYTVLFGQFYVRWKHYQNAINLYLDALKVHPNDVQLIVALGFAYISNEEPQKSYAAFSQALKLDPSNPDALVGMGRLAALAGNNSEAENLYQKALESDPNNLGGLSSVAALRMSEKRYKEAESIYEKLLATYPNMSWIKYAFESAKYAPSLDEIRRLEGNDSLEEVLDLYQKLVWAAPDNPDYYIGLGQANVRLKRFKAAWEAYKKGLEARPDSNELRVAWGYSYLFAEEPYNAELMFGQALQNGTATPEILAGLGRAQALQGNHYQAEELYQRALKINPNNVSALTFYAKLLTKEKRYPEAQEAYFRLWIIDPNVEWVVHAWQDARDGILIDLAECYENRDEFDVAETLYYQLLILAPDNADRYSRLGRLYLSMEMFDCAIDMYMEGLAVDPKAMYLWRGIAFAYIKKENYVTSRCILTYLVEIDPTDAEAWVGLARIEEMDGSECIAEEYYQYALQLDPDNVTALSYYSDFLREQFYYFDAAYMFYHLAEVDPEPKWVRTGYNEFLNLVYPVISITGGYHEEDQWDPCNDVWSARYQVYGVNCLLNYPYNNELTFGGHVADEYYVLRDTEDHFTIYSFDVQRAHAHARWVFSPHFALEGRLGASFFSPFQKSSFILSKGAFVEPSLAIKYQRHKERALFGFFSDSDIIARNFATNHAKLVGRYFLMGRYEREVIKRGVVGFEGDAYFYSDYVNNRSQRAYGWFDWRPPCYYKYLIFHYHFQFQRFDKNIPDYYTYKYQIINHFQVTVEKPWNVYWADTLFTSFGFAHGWQDTRTRFSQIIVIAPTATTPPFIMDRRNYNFIFANVKYSCNQIQMSLTADFYRDSEKYTIWSALANFSWRF